MGQIPAITGLELIILLPFIRYLVPTPTSIKAISRLLIPFRTFNPLGYPHRSSPTMTNKEEIAKADEQLLAELGYKQEFKRAFTPLEVMGASPLLNYTSLTLSYS